ncbi:replication protein A 70 kDa DNA-binding subunit A-like [Papaver somniferum]|uniref:replication protein A 70 kDa DNA-binding subunit A-like n=1 Tax=Papaver somniferum TaxID=3469 RepID=UPI000E6F80A7|nr:replication protein A 70 kDa DNA-binding subunit A-like [Papaver somniferum]
MSVKLTQNSISAILGGDLNLKPRVQVLDIKSAGKSQDRLRLLVSDSVSTQYAVIASQLNEKVFDGEIRKGSVVQLIDYMCNTIQTRKIILILNMETIIPECAIIGNPKVMSEPQSAPSDNNGGYQPRINSNMSAPTGNSNTTANFRPTVQPAYQPPAPNYRNHGSIVKNEAPARIIPIAALNPYQGRWAIKARVTAKGDLRRYNNARGDGKVFSFDLLDSDGGEIRVTCFNAVVDRFYGSVEVGKVYVVSKGSLKPARRDFNHLKNEWEIFLEQTSTLERCEDEDSAIPQLQFSFTPISEIENVVNNSILDVIGIVITVNPSVPITRKNGMETQRRTLVLKDGSSRTVEITLWGEFCNKEG